MAFGRRRLLQSALAAAAWGKTGWSQEQMAPNALSQVLIDKNKRTEQLLERKKDAPSLLPDRSKLGKKIPQGHPRIFFRPEDLERLRGKLDQPPFRHCAEAIRAEADATLARPFPIPYYPPDFYLPDGPNWDKRFPQSTASVAEHNKMMRSQSFSMIPSNAQAYLLTGDRRYLDQARRAMINSAELDLKTTGYSNTHGFNGVIPQLAVGLDYLWDALEANERQRMGAATSCCNSKAAVSGPLATVTRTRTLSS